MGLTENRVIKIVQPKLSVTESADCGCFRVADRDNVWKHRE